MNKIIKAIKNPKRVLLHIIDSRMGKVIPDSIFLKIKYRLSIGKKLDLRKPQTYNEKIQWLKLHDRRDIYTAMVDKYEVKKYVEKIIGKEYIIPTIGVYDNWEQINFEELPNQFVIKCTHDSGGLVICKDKNNFDYKKAKNKINRCLKRNYYYSGREWPYKNVKPRVIIEEYMEDKADNELRDYKIFCFNGTPQIMFIASERQNEKVETCFDFFDMDFNHLDIINGHPNSKSVLHKPYNFELMKKLSEKLSINIPHVRIDFYEVNKKVYFGEITFSHWSGMVPFEPEEWDYKLGDLINLNLVKE